MRFVELASYRAPSVFELLLAFFTEFIAQRAVIEKLQRELTNVLHSFGDLRAVAAVTIASCLGGDLPRLAIPSTETELFVLEAGLHSRLRRLRTASCYIPW